jgi:hypothetical protein
LVNVVTVKSTDVKFKKLGVADLQSVMGTVTADSPQPSAAANLEEHVGGLMQQAANNLASQLGGRAASGQRAGSFKSPFNR